MGVTRPEHTPEFTGNHSPTAGALQNALQIDPARLAEAIGNLPPEQREAILTALGVPVQ